MALSGRVGVGELGARVAACALAALFGCTASSDPLARRDAGSVPLDVDGDVDGGVASMDAGPGNPPADGSAPAQDARSEGAVEADAGLDGGGASADAAVPVPAWPTSPPTGSFAARNSVGEVSWSAIDEASGIVASRSQVGVLWVHNDSGDGPRVYAIDSAGTQLATFSLQGISPMDVEDLALGPGPSPEVDYLYIGDHGNNDLLARNVRIYRVPEPAVPSDADPDAEISLANVEVLEFAYPDGPHDCEALLIDPRTADLFLITKQGATSLVFGAAAPHSPTVAATLQQVGSLDFRLAVGGDISPLGDEILIKTYADVHYWWRGPEESVAMALTHPSSTLSYIPEMQGEAIGWAADVAGYYTLSEGDSQDLYFYARD